VTLSEILNHLGEDREQYFNAVAPPLIQTSNFRFNSMAEMKEAFEYERGSHLYTRGNNPTVTICAKKLAALEGTEDALLVGSGAAAISNSVLANVEQGDHIVSVNNVYTWADRLMKLFLPRFGVETTFVDGREVENIRKAIRPNTRIIYLESPTSLTMEMQDLKPIIALAKENGIITIIDNSYGSPLNNNPIQWGIDISLHSATKYIAGHSDSVAGVICSTKEMIDKIFIREMMTLGNILHPMDAWLILRSLRTLPMRVKHASESAQQVIAYLQRHPKVKRILYPFLPEHPQYELAVDQMPIPMPMFSVVFHTQDMSELETFVESLKHFLIAVSWGGHESLALPVNVDHHGAPLNLIRFYVGLEEAALLISDLEDALKKL
jgi:cystathionine beta-lyase/cystathionine gamma-synthase